MAWQTVLDQMISNENEHVEALSEQDEKRQGEKLINFFTEIEKKKYKGFLFGLCVKFENDDDDVRRQSFCHSDGKCCFIPRQFDFFVCTFLSIFLSQEKSVAYSWDIFSEWITLFEVIWKKWNVVRTHDDNYHQHHPWYDLKIAHTA